MIKTTLVTIPLLSAIVGTVLFTEDRYANKQEIVSKLSGIQKSLEQVRMERYQDELNYLEYLRSIRPLKPLEKWQDAYYRGQIAKIKMTNRG